MSVRQMGLVWELDLPKPLKFLLLAMADHADHDGGNVYPGVELLAWKTGDHPRTVQRSLRRLEELGLIEVEEPGGGVVDGGVRGRATVYRLTLEKGGKLSPFQRGNPGATVLGTPAPRTTEPRRHGARNPGTSATPTVIEPSVEPSEEPFALKRASRDPVSSPTSAPTRPRDPLWDTLVDILGAPSPAKTSLWGDRVKWIRAQPDGTPDKIRHVASRIVTEWGTRALTVNAVVDHWSRFDAEVGQVAPGDVTRAQADARHARIRAALNQPGGGHP